MSETVSVAPLHVPELSEEFVARNPVYLISADLPGCGSTSLASAITDRLLERHGIEPHVVEIGKILRSQLDVGDEASMNTRLREIGNPRIFDPDLYGNLPINRPCVIDGKLATTIGPQYIPESRPIVSINLTSKLLISAKRGLQAEGAHFSELLRSSDGGDKLLGHLAMLDERARHDQAMRQEVPDDRERSNVTSVDIDTSQVSIREIIETFAGTADFAERVPDWEMDVLKETLARLASLHILLSDGVHPNDEAHFQYQFESIRYNVERLAVTLHPAGIADVRETLRKSIVDCWFGLMMKQSPRFFANAEGAATLDTESQKWTPEFYKIAEGWPVLSSLLKDRSILDPFGGAGTLVNLLVARNIPSSAVLSDIAFNGGMPLNKEGHTYLPVLNGQMAQILFDDLPSWYKPDFVPIRGYVTSTANQLPFRDDAVDYIVADPPYGKNCATGGIGLLFGSLPEFNRVAKEGSILMVPMDWVKEIRASGHVVEQLTTDLSRGHSNLPVCYIKIASNQQGAVHVESR